jgi:hypothetical protein
MDDFPHNLYNGFSRFLRVPLPLQFQTEILPGHVREATAGVFWRHAAAQPKAVLGLLFLFGTAQALLWALVPALAWPWHAALASLMALSVWIVLASAERYYQGLASRNFSRFKGAPVRISLEEDAYCYEASWGRGTIAWSDFQSLWCLKNVWVLLQHAEGGASVLLPQGDLDPDARAFLKGRLAGVGAKVVG